MAQLTIAEELAKIEAIITGSHVVYTSGRHGDSYVNKDAIYPHTELISSLCERIATHFLARDPQVVAAPALGGIILSQWTAHHLTRLSGAEVLSVYAEKADDGTFIIKRGYDRLLSGKRVLIVEDVLTTGGSVKKVIELVRQIGGNVVGVGALCNRGGLAPRDIVAEGTAPPDLYALLEVSLDSWEAKDCPLCAREVPFNLQVGKAREFLAAQAKG